MKLFLFLLLLCLFLYVFMYKYSSQNIVILVVSVMLVVVNLLYTRRVTKEHFSIEEKDKRFVLIDFKESLISEMATNPLYEDLVYYISSFNKQFVNFDQNLLQNVVDNEIGALFVQDLNSYSMEYYHQNKGIRIEHELKLPSAKHILHSFDSFTVFWYCKLITPKDFFTGSRKTFSILQFDHENVINTQNFKLFDIIFTFSENMLNPDITIFFAGSILSNKYTYDTSDYYNRKIFCDGNYHLFTFSKHDSKFVFYVDNHKFIECEDEECFKKPQLYGNDTEIQIRNEPIRFNYNQDVLKMYLNALGFYRGRSLIHEEIIQLDNYFKSVKTKLQPEVYQLTKDKQDLQRELQKYTKSCPFSDTSICSSRECYGITNWKDISFLTSHSECLEKVSEHCRTTSNYTNNDFICPYLSKDNIFKMASSLDSNLFMYNPANSNNVSNEEILQQLQRLGLKNIYLDKSFRDNRGQYSGEMQRLINDLLTTNQTVDLDTLDSLYTTRSNTYVTSPISLNDQVSLSNTSTVEQIYNELLASVPESVVENRVTDSNTNLENTNLIDLDYDEVGNPNAYKHIINRHKKEKEDSSGSGWNIFNWFI